jgi:hypothetical protein
MKFRDPLTKLFLALGMTKNDNKLTSKGKPSALPGWYVLGIVKFSTSERPQ